MQRRSGGSRRLLVEPNAGRLEPAQEELRDIVREFPEVAKYRRALGQTHLVLGEAEEAEDELLRSLALDPRDPDALTLLGNLYMQSQRPEKAIPLYERSLKVQRNVYALTNLGAALAEAGRLQEPIQALRKATKVDPEHPNGWYGLGLALSRLENPETILEAIDALNRALASLGERRIADRLHSRQIREYTADLRTLLHGTGATAESLAGCLEWIEWAEEYANSLDPLVALLIPARDELSLVW